MKTSTKTILLAVASLLLVGLVFAKSGSSRFAWLGVETQTVNEELAEGFDLSVDYGAIVNNVYNDSPAEEAGIEEGDVIISFDGVKIFDAHDLIDMVEDHQSGDEVSLTVRRDDEDKQFTVTLESQPRNLRGKEFWNFGRIAPVAPIQVPMPPTPPTVWHFGSDNNVYMGITMDDLSEQLGEFFGVERGRGILIKEVEEDSPAKEAGLLAGDVIVAADGEKVAETDDLFDVLEDKEEGDKIALTIIRNKSEQTIEVTLDERADYNGMRFFHAPDMSIELPEWNGVYYSDFNNKMRDYFNSDEYKAQMEALKLDMELLKKEYRDDYKVQIDKLRKELDELREQLK